MLLLALMFLGVSIVVIVQTVRIHIAKSAEKEKFEEAKNCYKSLLEYSWDEKVNPRLTPRKLYWKILLKLSGAKKRPRDLGIACSSLEYPDDYERLGEFSQGKAREAAYLIKAELKSMKSSKTARDLLRNLRMFIKESGEGEEAFASKEQVNQWVTGTIVSQAYPLYERLVQEPNLTNLMSLSGKLGEIPDSPAKEASLASMLSDIGSSNQIRLDFIKVLRELADYAGMALPSDDAEELDRQAAPEVGSTGPQEVSKLCNAG